MRNNGADILLIYPSRGVRRPMIECHRMTADRENDAFTLLNLFLSHDEYYLDSSKGYGDEGSDAVRRALELFLKQPEIGFVWLAYDKGEPVAVCVVCFAISTSIGAVVAKLDDVFVKSARQGQGIGSALITQLKKELHQVGVRRIDTSVHLRNDEARRFYEKHAFVPLNEERLACLV
jgi:GNAT superfamily N-acetyltransferase